MAQKQREQLLKLLKPRIVKIFKALAARAEEGDVSAIKELLDRAWGKAPQPLTDPDGGPIQILGVEITVRK
jgi:hypothetical protein